MPATRSVLLAALSFISACAATPPKQATVAAGAMIAPKAVATARALPPAKYFSSIVWCVMENHGVDAAKALVSERQMIEKGASFKRYKAVTHPSGPNYRVIVAGAYWTHQEIYPVKKPTFASLIAPLGVQTIDWNVAGVPALRHDPYLELKSPITIRKDAFQPDGLPEHVQVYLGYDDDNDAHDGPMEVVDLHLKNLLTKLDGSKWFNTPDADGKYPVLMVTWDESYTLTNEVLTTFYGRGVKPGYVSPTTRDHYDLCRTLTDNWALPPLEDAAKARPIDDIWR
jgi:hypothetical protein